MFKRKHFDILSSRIREERRFIQVVIGPRQVGKSTMVKQVLTSTDTPFIRFTADCVPATNLAWVSQCWDSARAKMRVEHLSEHYVLEKKGALIAIEVKSNQDKTNAGLAEFEKQFKPQMCFVVGEGGVSAESFLSSNPAELLKL